MNPDQSTRTVHVDKWVSYCSELVDGVGCECAPDLGEVVAQVTQLREALAFYADPGSYDAIGPLGTVKGSAWRLAEDGGARARAALDEERASDV